MAFVLVAVLSEGTFERADDSEDKPSKLVEKLGGKVTRDEKKPGKPIVEVDLRNTKVTDSGSAELVDFKNLTSLDSFGTPVTDAGLKELAPLKNLITLGLL